MSSQLSALRHSSPGINAQLSPHILTPEAMHPPAETFTFTKQPITPGLLASPLLHSEEEYHSDVKSNKPVSLLTALLNSPENRYHGHASHPPSVISSAKSSAPSTAISSPSGQPYGMLKEPATSILRRGSTGSEGGEIGLGVMGLEGLAGRLERVEEKRETIEWADAQPSVQRAPSMNRLKFAIAPRHPQAMVASFSDSATSSRRPSSPFVKERVLQGESDEDDDQGEVYEAPDAESDTDEDAANEAESDYTDEGYEEDEEGGTFSDDEDYAADIPRGPTSSDFPFARSTNYRKRQVIIPSAPAMLPPPSRRGRGHIKVAEPIEQKASCSRHCSPPPRSRSGSNGNISRMSRSPSRLSDAGPRANRAGSPMPSRVDSSDEDERLVEETHSVFEDDLSSVTDGVRDFLRRASEHIPGQAGLEDKPKDISAQLSRARSLNSKVTFQTRPPRERSAVDVPHA